MIHYHMDVLKDSFTAAVAPDSVTASFPFSVLVDGIFSTGQDYFTERSGQNFHILLYTLTGEGLITTENQQITLSRHQAVLLPSYAYHKYQNGSANSWDFAWAHLTGIGVSDYESSLNRDKIQVITPGDTDHFFETFQNLYRITKEGTLLSCARCSHYISGLLTGMLEGLVQDDAGTSPGNSDIAAIVEYLQLHYQEAVSIDALLSKVHFSKYHFIRLFKKQVGTTPYSYLTGYRISQSKRLLCTTHDSISDIASQVGFTGESNFIHQFKSIVGETPAAYRKNNWGF